MEITLERAADFLYELRETRPICVDCTTWSYKAVYEHKIDAGKEPYWHHDALTGVITQRCNTCLSKLSYPWALKLSEQQLLTWLRANPPHPGCEVDLERLRDDLTVDRGGFRFL